MELGILAGVGAIGYLLNQRERKTNFKHENQESLRKYINSQKNLKNLATNNGYGYIQSDADTFPLYSPSYVKHQQQILSGISPKSNQEKNMPSEFKRQSTSHPLEEEFGNYIPSNDPASEQLLDLNQRPITDFYHNNMVPFYGSRQTQSMAGTGVASGSYIDGSNVPGNVTGVNSGFDFSTPFQTQLATFTGSDDTYLHKREVGPMFSPAEQQTGYVFGMPLFRPDMDRYTQSLSNIRNDLAPVEPERVGKGLNLDPSIPAAGGFHEFTRILPNNVNDYKANQLPGLVIKGKYFSAGLPESYPGIGLESDKQAPGVTKNKPNSYWDQARYPTMTTKVGFQNNFDYNIPDYTADFKPNNAQRDQISYGLGNLQYQKNRENFGGGNSDEDIFCVNEEVSIGQGPMQALVKQTPARSETWMSQDHNIRSRYDCNSLPIGNPARPEFGQGNIIANYYVNETDRGTVNPQNVMQLNLSAERQGSAFWTYVDEPKTTTKSTTEYAFAGNPSRGNDGELIYSFVDEPKTTTKITTEYAFAGNPSRGNDGELIYSFVDEPKTTTKSTTEYAFAGNPTIPGIAETSRSMFTGFGG